MAGLRGINLSGGQRQRLNLARCAYAPSDLVLLDNALSAVDHHTAHHIFKHCIRDLMGDKAVVLITHQVEFLPQCDRVAIMDEGRMIYFGPYNERAHQMLSTVLPASHLLAAAGAAEQPRDPSAAKKPKAKPSGSGTLNLGTTDLKVRGGWGVSGGSSARSACLEQGRVGVTQQCPACATHLLLALLSFNVRRARWASARRRSRP